MAYIAYGTRQGPVSNVLRRVNITVMHATTTLANPHPFGKGQLLVDCPTGVAGLRGGVEPINLDDALPVHHRKVLKDLHKPVEAKVADLPAPQALHPIEAKVFHHHYVVPLKHSTGCLEAKVPPLIGNATMQLRHAPTSLLPVVRPSLLAKETALELRHLLQGSTKMLRRLDGLPIAHRQKRLEPKVHTHGTTRLWHGRLNLLNNREANPEVTAAVSLNRDGLNLALNRTGEAELKGMPADAKPVTSEILPAALRQRERRVLRPLLESRPTRSRFREEPLVRPVEPLNHVLTGLRVKVVPMPLIPPLESGKMPFEPVVPGILPVERVVPSCQGNEVVPYLGSKRDLPNEVFVPLRAVEAVAVCPANLHRLGLCFDVLLNSSFADPPRRRNEVAPEAGEPEQVGVLVSEDAAASSLESSNVLVRSVTSVGMQKQVNGKDRQLDNLPHTLGGDFFDDLMEPLRAEHEVVLHGVARSAVNGSVDTHMLSTRILACGSRKVSRTEGFGRTAVTGGGELAQPTARGSVYPRLKNRRFTTLSALLWL